MENVEIVIEDWPSQEQLEDNELGPADTLFGLYEGVPLTERTMEYGLVPPDKITIFQKAIESECSSEAEVIEEVRLTVQHEIAHFFGIDDARLDELGRS
jgi:predicted Zn-dependent protease with MMP-like domain